MAKYDAATESMPDLFDDEPSVNISTSKHLDTSTSKHLDKSTGQQVNILTKPFTVRLPASLVEGIERAFAQHALDTGRKASRGEVFARLIRDHLSEYLGAAK